MVKHDKILIKFALRRAKTQSGFPRAKTIAGSGTGAPTLQVPEIGKLWSTGQARSIKAARARDCGTVGSHRRSSLTPSPYDTEHIPERQHVPGFLTNGGKSEQAPRISGSTMRRMPEGGGSAS